MQSAAKERRVLSGPVRLDYARIVSRDIILLALVIGAAAGALIIADVWIDHALKDWLEWSVALALVCGAALVIQLVRLSIIWRGHLQTNASRPEAANWSELFGYLFGVQVVLSGIVFLSTRPGIFGDNTVAVASTENFDPVHVAILLGMFALSFVPLLTAFAVQARFVTNRRGHRIFRTDVVSQLSLAVMICLFGGIAALAWAAAGRMFAMTDDFGILVTGVVIVAFFVTILAPHIGKQWNDWTERRDARGIRAQGPDVLPLRKAAEAVSQADSFLVRLVAPLSGATQKRYPHLLLFIVMLPLSALGYELASPWGLVPIAVGMLIVLALGRRWAWLEDDRETASRLQSTESDDIHIGFENDLKDEALLGYAWLFILVPLALNQLQEWTGSFNANPDATSGNPLWDWLRFFGSELAKAVPFVDWWEIYDVDVRTPFDASSGAPLAKHLTFISRALVDVVIMAALFQALGIWQRGRTQQRLYDSGQLDYFDPFTEIAFFETGMQRTDEGMKPKKRFEERIEKHVKARTDLGRPQIPYSTHRLAELLKSESQDVREGAEWLVAKYGVLTGAPREQLSQLRNRWLRFPLPKMSAEQSAKSLELIRHEKIEFERVLTNVKPVASELNEDDLGALFELLNTVKGAREFGYARDLAYECLGQNGSELAVGILAMTVLQNRHHQHRPDLRERIARFCGFAEYPTLVPSLFEDQADARERVYEKLAMVGESNLNALRVRKLCLELLEWMAIPGQANDGLTGDRARSSAQAAKDAAAKVVKSLGLDE